MHAAKCAEVSRTIWSQRASGSAHIVPTRSFPLPHDTRYPTDVGTRSPINTIWINNNWFRDYAADHPRLGLPRNFTDAPNVYNAFRQYGSSFRSDTVEDLRRRRRCA